MPGLYDAWGNAFFHMEPSVVSCGIHIERCFLFNMSFVKIGSVLPDKRIMTMLTSEYQEKIFT
jgi:hypothetical protein